MPGHPHQHPRVQKIRPSVFAVLAEKMRRTSGRIYPLHIGDTYRLPPEGALCSTNRVSHPEGLYRYGHPFGMPELLEALQRKLHRQNALEWVSRSEIQITCGATHALFCAAQSILGPEDEVLLLAPFWPLILGIIQCTGAKPVQVPFYQALLEHPGLDPIGLIEPYLSPRTAAIYVNSPNNPSGLVLGRAELEALASLCSQRSLWALSDEAYEDYLYDGREHVSVACLMGMRERTITAFTFSKSHALSGMRVGYVVAPRSLTDTLRKITNHSVFNTPVVAQRAALAALELGQPWLAESKARYEEAADLVRTGLKGRFLPAQGGAYVFYDTSSVSEDVWSFIDGALEAGVSVAPGEAFGRDFEKFARICFTAVDRPELIDALHRLNSLL